MSAANWIIKSTVEFAIRATSKTLNSDLLKGTGEFGVRGFSPKKSVASSPDLLSTRIHPRRGRDFPDSLATKRRRHDFAPWASTNQTQPNYCPVSAQWRCRHVPQVAPTRLSSAPA